MKKFTKRPIKASTELTPNQKKAGERIYKACQELLDKFEDLPTGTIDKLGDIGSVYHELINYLPGLHYVLYGDSAEDLDSSTKVSSSKRKIKASDMNEYTVTVNFATYTGVDEDYTEYASSEKEAIDQAIEEAKYDLEVVSVTETDEDTYEVDVVFAGYSNVVETYVVLADDEDEAEELAIEEAASDLSAEIQ